LYKLIVGEGYEGVKPLNPRVNRREELIDRRKIPVLPFDWGSLQSVFGTSQQQDTKPRVITGYNTDVEYNGVVYHVQTEDKGLQSPIILSLVYIKGAILASKRAPYDDLIASGFDKQVLAERLQRQHKLICAAVLAGRIEDLKRMSDGAGVAGKLSAIEAASSAPPVAAEETPAPPPLQSEATPAPLDNETTPPPPESETTLPPAESDAVERPSLSVRLLDEPELRGGCSVVLKVLVDRKANYVRTAAEHVKVTVRTLGTAFAPNKMQTSTDSNGLAVVSLTLPDFQSGRAAVLIRAEDGKGLSAELRRIVVSRQD